MGTGFQIEEKQTRSVINYQAAMPNQYGELTLNN